MAKLSGKRFAVVAYTERGGVVRAILTDGRIMVKRGARHVFADGRVTVGATPNGIAERWRALGIARVRVHSLTPDAPILTEAAAAKRARAAERAAERREAKAREVAYLTGATNAEALRLLGDAAAPDAALPDPNASEPIVRLLAAAARQNLRLSDARLAYVIGMARWHGGANSAWLGNAISVAAAFPREYRYRSTLDAFADAVAAHAFGSHMRAAQAWAPALRGMR